MAVEGSGSDWSKNETNEKDEGEKKDNNKSAQEIIHSAHPINMRRVMKRIWNKRMY